MSKLTIIIVNWNTGSLLGRCLESIAGCSDSNAVEEVVVIDNNSLDRSVVMAKNIVGSLGNKPPVRFVMMNKNLGFARACNEGIERWERSEYDSHVLLLNPDTRILEGALSCLAESLGENGSAGIVGPRILNEDGSVQESVRSFPNLGVLITFILKITKVAGGFKFWRNYMMADFNYEKKQEVDQVMGACFLIRNEVVSLVGHLNEDYWIWFEEVDYCRRVKKAGWKVIYDPKPQIVHVGGVSFGRAKKIKKMMAWLRSIKVYAKRHLPGWQYLIILLLFPVGVLEACLVPLFYFLVQRND